MKPPEWIAAGELRAGDLLWNGTENEGYPVVLVVPVRLPVTVRPDDDPYAPAVNEPVDCVVIHSLRAEWDDQQPGVVRPIVVRGADVCIASTPVQAVRATG